MTVVITGGAGRIGSAIVHALCERNIPVIVQFHQSVDQAQSLQHMWPDLVSLYQCDLNEAGELEGFVSFLRQQSSILGLVNNAGCFHRNPMGRSWDSLLAEQHYHLNTLIPLRLCQELTCLLNANQGSIVNVVDNVSGSTPWPNHAGYCASKAGLLAITRSLAVELAPRIRVNAVGPGLILESKLDSPNWQHLTSKIPMKRWGTPKEVAETVYFLLFGPAYITGQLISVDGGWSLAP